MCGIIGIFNSKNAIDQIKKGLKIMQARGRDASDLAELDSGAIGHNLHAIVSHVPQPIENCFVANCEVYNWQELNNKYNLKAKNDADLIYQLLKSKGVESLEELDGVFALAYAKDNQVILARDIIGVKPLWFAQGEEFAFASEKKALEQLGFVDIREVHPRSILTYDIEKKESTVSQRPFFEIGEDNTDIDQLITLLKTAVKKRTTDQKMGVLLSGGIDSTLICLILKQLGQEFTCYTAAIDETAQDLIHAREFAKLHNLELKEAIIKTEEVPKYLQTIVPLIEDSNVVKVGVALPFYTACEIAAKDGIRVMFSGLGSEELFAGYERHEQSTNINQECLIGLKQMYERDLYRDDVLTMHHSIELRLPLLDHNLTKYALKIPADLKIKEGFKKHILRVAATKLGLEEQFAWRKKKAAQYGSKFDKALQRLAKQNKTTRSEYLRSFYKTHNLKLGILYSGGKDSTYAAYLMKKMNYDITCLISIISENDHSYMFHTPNMHMVDMQAKTMDIPLIKQTTKGEKEVELEDLKIAIIKAKEEYQLDGIVTGALYSSYQRNRVEKICDELGLKIFNPLWHKNQEEEMRELIDLDFEIIFTSTAADGLGKEWLNKVITIKDVDKLVSMSKTIGHNVAGEGGEFESLVLNCPLFNQSIEIVESSIQCENEHTTRLTITNARLR